MGHLSKHTIGDRPDIKRGQLMTSRHDTGWDRVYHRYGPEDLPWELGRPRLVLTELVASGRIKPCKALDLCCGVGTNPAYLAGKGFDVTALDISDGAVHYARSTARRAGVTMNLLVSSFLNLPFGSEKFGFVFDFGCFHHVKEDDRGAFIQEVHRVLKPGGQYLMVCFSDRNGSSWNHFSREQIVQLFSGYFEIDGLRHVSSLEGDNVRRHFYEVLMEKPRD